MLLVPGMNAHDAAAALLSHTWIADDEESGSGTWKRHQGPISRMDDNIWDTSAAGADRQTLMFQSHRIAAFPDTKAGAPCDAVVHEFTLDAQRAELVNAVLREHGDSEYYSGRESAGKSAVGGYHGEVEIFRAAKPDAWYRTVHDIVLAALSVVEPRWRGDVDHEGASEGTAPDVSGWLNASRRLDYNSLHSHEGPGCVWSCVYYAYDGSEPDPRTLAPSNFTRSRKRAREGLAGAAPPLLSDDERSGLLGALLLRTRPQPLVQSYSFTPITPSAGRLVIFPAHLQHAVMPRALRCAPVPLSVVPWALSLRISVAMNAYAPGTFGPGAVCFGSVLFTR
jgi:hypothetical protein